MEKVRAKVILNGVRTSLYTQPRYDYTDQKQGYPKYVGYETKMMHSFDFGFVSGNNDPESDNTKFWEASPSGQLRLDSVNPEVAEIFTPLIGKEFYLDFIPAQ